MDRSIFEESSGNVFADLGFDNADEMLTTTGFMVLSRYEVFPF
jgi:hypothetical protein